MKITSQHLRGILLAVGIAAASIWLADILHFSGILIALVLGIIIGNARILKPSFDSGIKLSSSLFLELAIVLMAFSIDYGSFLRLGWQTILIVVVTIFAVLYATLKLSKRMNCPSSAGILVGFGTAICGSSAIAALAPSVSKDKGDMGIAMAVVNLYGLLGMILLPALATDWLSELQSSVLIGASLHSVGNVAGAGVAMSDAIGEMAVTVKLGRVALLTPALLIFGHFASFDSTADSASAKLKLPWYLVTFIVISILVSLIDLPTEVLQYTKTSSNFLLAAAMAAIGIKVSFKTLFNSGKKGLLFGAILFVVQLAVIGLLIWGLGV